MIMSSLCQTLFLAIPFLISHVAAYDVATPLKFIYPKPGRIDYEFAEGDEVVVQWEPRVQLSKVFVNCSSVAKLEGQSSSSELEFVNAYSGVLYRPHPPEDGDKTYCTFCAGQDAEICSGVFHLAGKLDSFQNTVTSNAGPVVVVTKTDYKTDCPESTSAAPTSSQDIPAGSSSPATTSLPPLLTFGAVNSSAPTWTVSLPPAMSLPPYVSVDSSGGVSTIGVVPGTGIIAPPAVGTGTAPYTTVTIIPQGWNATNQVTNSSATSTVAQTQPILTTPIRTPSLAPLPTPSASAAAGSWPSSVDFALFGLFVVGASAFVIL